MKPFLSTVINKIDAKGRVSVPAAFRAVVKQADLNGVVCFPSIDDQAIEGCTMAQIENFSEIIDQLPPFSAERDALAELILGRSHDIGFDAEGRIKLPEVLIDYAAVAGEVMFIGLGRKFQIWNPTIHQETEARRRDLARENKSRLTFLDISASRLGGKE